MLNRCKAKPESIGLAVRSRLGPVSVASRHAGASSPVREAFSLIELVIVVLILGIIAAIAIARMSRGSAGAAESALRSDLKMLRRAIEMFAAEHDGLLPEKDSTIVDQLTLYTDLDGNTSPTRTGVFIYGPYLRAMPALPVGENKGSAAVRDGGNPGDGDEGWFYDKDTGQIWANTKDAELDLSGQPFNQY